MSTSYTSLLGLALPVTGELSGTWGSMVDNAITSPLDIAVAGTQSITGDSNVTLSVTNGDTVGTNLAQVGSGSTGSAQYAIILCTGARTALRTITAPAASKIYTVINATTGGFSVKIVGAGPTTGVTIVAGESALIAWNGSDFIKISSNSVLGGLTVTSLTDSGLTSGRVTYAGTGGLLQDSANMTFNGTVLTSSFAGPVAATTLSASSTVSGTGFSTYLASPPAIGGTAAAAGSFTTLSASSTTTLSGGTANGVAYLNGSKVLTTGSALVFDGTNLGVGVTPSASWTGGGVLQQTIGAIYGNSSLGAYDVSYNSIRTASNSYVYAQSSLQATRLQQRDGAFNFFTAPSGIAGDPITFTQAMTLDTSGYLGVGTTAPVSRIHVAGPGFGATTTVRIDSTSTSNSAPPSLVLTRSSSSAMSSAGIGNVYFSRLLTDASSNTAASIQVTGNNSSVSPTATINYDVLTTQAWKINGTEQMRLDSSGNLGLGVTPTNKLTVIGNTGTLANSSIRVNGSAGTVSSNSGLWLSGNQSTSHYNWLLASQYNVNQTFEITPSTAVDGATFSNPVYSVSAGGLHKWFYGTTQSMTLDTAGNLGLGVTPSAWSQGKAFEVFQAGYGLWNGTSSSYILANAYYNSGFKYGSTAQASHYYQYQGQHVWSNAPSGTAGNAITFTQAMTLNASGYLGIGATSPNSQLDIRFPATTPSNQLNQVLLQSLSDGSSSGLGARTGITFNNRITDYVTSGGISTAGVYGINLDPLAYGRYMGLVFYTSTIDTAATEKMRIDEAGNLGLGVTPSAWNTFTGIFEQAYGSFIAAYTNQTNYGLNAYFNGTNWIYKNTAASTRYNQSSGAHYWYNASSGTAGNAITFTQAMTLDASGNLLVGATTVGTWTSNSFGVQTSAGFTVTAHASGTATGTAYSYFDYANSPIGSITQSGTTAVLYNVTSDQRLKENIVDAAPASDLIDSLQVRQFDWKTDNTHQRYGFVAQELVTVAPEAVHQPADPEEMMAVDYSKLVPMLVKEIQDLRKRLAAAGI